MKKNLSLVLFLILVVFVSGCSVAQDNYVTNNSDDEVNYQKNLDTEKESEPAKEGTYDSDKDEVNYSNSNLEFFPSEVLYLQGLRILRLSNNKIESLPSEMGKLKDLEELYLNNNLLTGALPAEIRMLEKLRILDASDNQLTGIPAEIGQLKNLRILDMSNNDIDTMPNELYNLTELQKLDLRGNNYSSDMQKEIKNKMENTEVLF